MATVVKMTVFDRVQDPPAPKPEEPKAAEDPKPVEAKASKPAK